MSIPLTYLSHEEKYRLLVSEFLSGSTDAQSFTDEYFTLWKLDRDSQWEHISGGGAIDSQEQRLSTFLDLIFTACDSYCPEPIDSHEISATQLRNEVATLAKQCWPNDHFA